MAKREVTKIELKADPADMRSLYKAFQVMDKEVAKELRQEVYKISDYVAQNIKRAAETAPMPQQAKAVAASVKARRDRVPTIVIGGATRARVSRKGTARNPKPATGELLYGSEFGAPRGWVRTWDRRYKDKQGNYRTQRAKTYAGRFANGGFKFPERSPKVSGSSGNQGYWIYPTLKRLQPRITRDYHEAVYRFLTGTWGK